ncbi:MAG: aldo/keto reductase [Myxococcota bacterium]
MNQAPYSPRALGRTTLRVSPIAYGCWRFAGTTVNAARTKVEAALERGIDFFDHADIYGFQGQGGFGDAESLFGEVLAEAPQLRSRMVIATKGGITPPVPYNSSIEHLRLAAEASLRRLRIDVIDLYQIHRPDFLAHPEDVARALSDLREAGKIREVGVSNYTVAQTRALQAHLSFPLATHQPELSPWAPAALRDGVLDLCMETGMTPLAWSPLAGGRLGLSLEEAAGEPRGAELVALLTLLDRIASEQGVTRAAVAIAWVMHHPSRAIPILGTQRIDRLEACLAARQVSLTRQQWNEILVASEGRPLP